MNTLSELPRIWYVKVNSSNKYLLQDWKNSQLNVDKTYDCKFYVCNHPFLDRSYMDYNHTADNIKNLGGVEITTEQFKNWVMKEKVSVPEKWCVRITRENQNALAGFWNEQSGNTCYTGFSTGFFHSHNRGKEGSILAKGNYGASFHDDEPRDVIISYETFVSLIAPPKFVLPKNWYVVVTEENRKVLAEWRFDNTINTLPIGYITGLPYDDNRKGHNPPKEVKSETFNFGTEITFEQFNQYILKKPTTKPTTKTMATARALTSLPAKWYTKRNRENASVLNGWGNSQPDGSGMSCATGYVCNTNLGNSSSTHYYASDRIPTGHTEISFAQFEEWVLNAPKGISSQFFIRLDENNQKELGKFWNEQSGNMCYNFSSGCMHSHNNDGESILEKGNLSASFHKSSPLTGFTEITMSQFKSLIKQSTMKAKTFGISGSEPLLSAMWKELLKMGYVADHVPGGDIRCISSTFTTSNKALESLTDFKRLYMGHLGANTIETQYDRHFSLPTQWNECMAFAKEQLAPKYWVVAAKPVVLKFATIDFTVDKANGVATSSYGKITKSDLEQVIKAMTPNITILGYNMELTSTDVKFGCQTGTLAQAKALLAAM